MTEVKRFSWSQLDLLSKCPQKWYLRYVERIRRPIGTALVRGSAVDASITHSLTAKLEGAACSVEEVQQVARDKIDDLWGSGVALLPEEEEAGEIATKGALVDTAVGLSSLHYRELRPKLDPIEKPQRWWEVTVRGFDCTIVGVFDTRTRPDDEQLGPQLHDHKTKSRKPSPEDAETDQLTMYAMAARAIDGKNPERLWLDTLVATKTQQTVHRLETVRGDADFRRLLLRIERAIKTVESGVFMPAPDGAWWCSARWCEYWNDPCPFGARGRVRS